MTFTVTVQPPFAIGDIVETIDGPKFWGEVISCDATHEYRAPSGFEWIVEVRATAADFLGTTARYSAERLVITQQRSNFPSKGSRPNEKGKGLTKPIKDRLPIGCTVKLTTAAAEMFPKDKRRQGRVVSYSRGGSPYVIWEGFKTMHRWHPDMLRVIRQ